MIRSVLWRTLAVFACIILATSSAHAACEDSFFEDWSYSSSSDPDFHAVWKGYWTETISGGLSAITWMTAGGLLLENASNPYWAGMRRDICDTGGTSETLDVRVTPANTVNRFVVGIRTWGSSATAYQVALTFQNGTIYAEDDGVNVAVGTYSAGYPVDVYTDYDPGTGYYQLRLNHQYVGSFEAAYKGTTDRHVVLFDHGGYSGGTTVSNLRFDWAVVVGN